MRYCGSSVYRKRIWNNLLMKQVFYYTNELFLECCWWFVWPTSGSLRKLHLILCEMATNLSLGITRGFVTFLRFYSELAVIFATVTNHNTLWSVELRTLYSINEWKQRISQNYEQFNLTLLWKLRVQICFLLIRTTHDINFMMLLRGLQTWITY
jgi:hypothetical protein